MRDCSTGFLGVRRMLGGALVVCAVWCLTAASAQRVCDANVLAALPIVERPARSDTNSTLVILLTGDGNWANADEKVSDGLRARGAAVVGLGMRSYLRDKKTPEQAAADVACIATQYLVRWKRQRVMLLGYSRGADIVPFVAARWPESLRSRLNMIALVSLSQTANFQFHLMDLVRDVKRSDDVAVAPEIEKLRGLRVICVYGSDEPKSGCLTADSSFVMKYSRDGGHRLRRGFEAVDEILEQGLRPRE